MSESNDQQQDEWGALEQTLQQYFPAFVELVEKNEALWKALRESDEEGWTIFAPNNAAFEALGEKKLSQLSDVRNLETNEKIGLYHAIGEIVTPEALFASGGIITVGGEVPVGRSVKGGLFGIGGTEDGGVTVNGARVLNSVPIGTGIVHEVDALISPSVLWRYMDQLRIPGST